jgi:succinyl-diaminopimelate desuccinylase
MTNPLISLTSKLIEIPSTSDNLNQLQEIIDFVENYFTGSNVYIKRYLFNNKPSIFVSLSNNQTQLILNGHADVVPAKPYQFKPKLVGKRLYGRGAQDMKSGLAAMMLLTKILSGKQTNLPLGLMVVTDEEIGGFDGTKYLLNQEHITSDLFIAGESTDLKIEYEAKGIVWIKITTQGKRAHGAYLWEGDNAITKLAHEINSISNLYPIPNKNSWVSTCNISQVSGGLAVNQVPDAAEVKLDIRRVPSESAESIVSKIKSCLIHPDTQVELIFNEPSHQCDVNFPQVQLLSKLITHHLGKPAEFIQKCGASDARHYSSKGIKAVCFGPSGAGLHTDSEYLDMTSLQTYYDILLDFTFKYFGV